MNNYQCENCYQHFQTEKLDPSLIVFRKDSVAGMVFCCLKCKTEYKPRRDKHKHKFKAKPCESDGIKFGSKAERAYYHRLQAMQKAGEVAFFLRQVPFDLPGNTKYFVDFQVFHSDGTITFIDVKGMSTPMFIMKKKQVEDLYPIEIEVVH